MRKKIIIERDPGEEPNCSNCLDIPLFGCVACPRPLSRADKLQEKLDEIDLEVDMAFETHKPTLVEESRKRYDALLRIRGIIHRGKKNDR